VGAGRMRGRNHIKTPQNTPKANVLLSVLRKFDLNLDAFGVSTGAVEL
jgi:hypothetical protein